MRKHFSTILLVLILMTGLSLLLYPTVSDAWNALHQTRAIDSYTANVARINDARYKEILQRAEDYNANLFATPHTLALTESQIPDYESQLNVAGDGIMGYIEIPQIDCTLPIYHGTEAAVLQIAIGHMNGSSLPVGGPSTHTVLSGHRGLPSARLFSRLDEMETGDRFMLHVLDETLTYEVDQIRIVLPDELDELSIEEGQDLCTLVTCTPYGINTHRLLVRGRRVENAAAAQEVRVTADAMQIEPLYIAPIVAAPLLLILLILLLAPRRHRYRRSQL